MLQYFQKKITHKLFGLLLNEIICHRIQWKLQSYFEKYLEILSEMHYLPNIKKIKVHKNLAGSRKLLSYFYL